MLLQGALGNRNRLQVIQGAAVLARLEEEFFIQNMVADRWQKTCLELFSHLA